MAIPAAFPFHFTVNSSLVVMLQSFHISTPNLSLVFVLATAAGKAAAGPLTKVLLTALKAMNPSLTELSSVASSPTLF
jgi:hypothetical protein